MVLARLACILLIGALAPVNVRPPSLSRQETTDRAFKQRTFWYSVSTLADAYLGIASVVWSVEIGFVLHASSWSVLPHRNDWLNCSPKS